jgi:preprotein translocase subunit YajC
MDIQLILIVVVLAALIFFMFRSSRKRQKDAAKLQETVVVGADVMTNFGLFGKIVSINEDDNKVEIETAPGTVVTVHRQTIGRVISPEELVEEEAIEAEQDEKAEHDAADLDQVDLGEPEFGERVEPTAKAAKKSTDKAE